MYTQFFGLRERPFALTANTHYLYLSEEHAAAFTMLKYGIMQRSGIVLMTGGTGTGKTLLVRHLLSQGLPPACEVIKAMDPFVIGEDLVTYLVEELGIEECEDGTRACQLRALEKYLLQRRREKKHVLLVVDEAQVLSDRILEEVRMINNLQQDQDMLLQVLLVGQPELQVRIKTPAMRPLAQRITVACHLGPMSPRDTLNYVEHRLSVAGREGKGLFDTGAIKAVFRATQGVPREINILCDTAMTYGFAEEADTIDQTVIAEVIADRRKSGLGLEDVQPVGREQDEDIESLRKRIQEMETSMKRMKQYLARQLKNARS